MSTTTAKTDQDEDERHRPGEPYWDFERPGSKVPVEVEAAYRRGYQQGAYLAVDAIRRGCSLSDLKHWVEITLHRWRYSWRQPRATLGWWVYGRLIKVVGPPEGELEKAIAKARRARS
jgi:hypothetical protein